KRLDGRRGTLPTTSGKRPRAASGTARSFAMANGLYFALLVVTALGCGLVAGIFFAFSNFVIQALGRLPPAQGIAAMQSINVTVLNRWFLLTFVGTAAASVLVIVAALLRWGWPETVVAI